MSRSFPIAGIKHAAVGAGLAVLGATGLHRLPAPWTRGRGAILTFHRVCVPSREVFAPNALLEITPTFLDRVLTRARQTGYEFVPLDAVVPRLRRPGTARPMLALTFDDGYRDTLTDALPVLERHAAPFTVFATTGFLDRTARLWWVELEQAIRTLPAIDVAIGGRRHRLPAGSSRDKSAAFAVLRQRLLALSDGELLAVCAALCAAAGVEPRGIVEALCLDWSGLRALAAHPLATVGCHTATHPRLARLPATAMRAELQASQSRLEEALRRPVRHLCYPYGFAAAAGPREFAAARALGFATGVTTRPGVLHPHCAETPTALPRISVNGLFQTTRAFDVLLSGAGFGVWNRVTRLITTGRVAPSSG